MLATHNFRILNPTISQTPLCQTIKATVQPTSICSRTTDLRTIVWIESHQDHDNEFEVMSAEYANEYYTKHKTLPEVLESRTDLVDPLLTYLDVFFRKNNEIQNFSITPVLSTGLLHEVFAREQENPNVYLSKQQIEVSPEKWMQHGQLMVNQEGVLKTFLLPNVNFNLGGIFDTQEKQYIVLNIDVENYDVATGFIGIGLPSIALLGLSLSDLIERDVQPSDCISFALGFYDIDNGQGYDAYVSLRNQNSFRHANLKMCVVLYSENYSDYEKIASKLNEDFKINNHTVIKKTFSITNEIPRCYWVRDMESDVNEFIEKTGKDALGAAFYFSEKKLLSIPVITGFILLDKPTVVDYIDGITYPHAWTEYLFRSVELLYTPFSDCFLFHKLYDEKNRILEWKQN